MSKIYIDFFELFQLSFTLKVTELILCLVIANDQHSTDSVWLSFFSFDSDGGLFNGLSFFSLL